MCITEYERAVSYLRIRFNREERNRFFSGCSAVAATVRAFAVFHCKKREGRGQVCVEYGNASQKRRKPGDLPRA